jgi:murein L,D-transpeptidase YcbB/YkuD
MTRSVLQEAYQALAHTIHKSVLLILSFLLCWCFVLIPWEPAASGTEEIRVAEVITQVLSDHKTGGNIMIQNERILDVAMVKRFYTQRNFRPAWLNNDIRMSRAHELLDAIQEAYADGLIPEYYHLNKIKLLLQEVQLIDTRLASAHGKKFAELDLLLSDAFFLLSCHLSSGCVNPIAIEAEWFSDNGVIDVIAVLEKGLQENAIKESLRNLIPREKMYHRLRQALSAYRSIQSKGGWTVVSPGRVLKIGMRDARVSALRQRLIRSSDLSPEAEDTGDLYNHTIEKTVLRFQRRHGLHPDGVVGPKTIRELNVSVEERVRQIELNLERLRWSFRNLGSQYILVNIADYRLEVVEDGKTVLAMKVIVGKPYWHTPVFSAEMTYLEINPTWNVPDSILQDDLLPKIKNDPTYFTEQDFTVLDGWGENAERIDPLFIDWTTVSGEDFPYRLRQEPGPRNPLGRIKFMFPNEFNVYLHDTPHRALFEKNVRTFSHGCIRLSQPIDAAVYLLQNDHEWTKEKILEAVDSGETQIVRLKHPVRVHILYLTAWVDTNGLVQFREDIYSRDERLDKALKKPPS